MYGNASQHMLSVCLLQHESGHAAPLYFHMCLPCWHPMCDNTLLADVTDKAAAGVYVLDIKVPGQLVRQGVERGSGHGVGDAGLIAGPACLVM